MIGHAYSINSAGMNKVDRYQHESGRQGRALIL
jgi:hypothetical protein